MVEVLGTTEFEEWFLGLGSADARTVVRGVGRSPHPWGRQDGGRSILRMNDPAG